MYKIYKFYILMTHVLKHFVICTPSFLQFLQLSHYSIIRILEYAFDSCTEIFYYTSIKKESMEERKREMRITFCNLNEPEYIQA